MILNYKGIDYKSEWVEYPDLAPKFKEKGIPPNDKNEPGYFKDYTSPAVGFDDGTYVMESWKIAQGKLNTSIFNIQSNSQFLELEKRYPTPSLHLDDPIVPKIRDFIGEIFTPLRAEILPKIPRNLLSEVSAEYFETDRAKLFGMPLSQLEKEKGGDEAWEKAKKPAKEAGDMLREHGGPFFLGEKVTYADLIFVSFLEFLRRSGDGMFEKWMALDPAFEKVYEASKEWLKRAD
ncbi:hypothetical protein M011DRAFT_425067 [Sporormia fimetaria CBS 119925]|uniref:Glutathione S-transferase UstS-like C-terminal domain-containing protein n=1 Tax=Sporormia fimetaria CBS 119925 TaxID=1340428 RepID=A0A6A6V742_9PLEO|nr:hypothetical protein M011DRAFT_425067 [Sporormia fimetaria CBS 119925]